MRMKKRVTISLVLLTLAMILAGCGGISKKEEQAARELINQMIVAADGAVVSKSDCTTEFEAKLTYDEEKVWNCGVKYETHNEYDKESGRADSEVTFYNGEEPFKARFHMNEEQGVFYIYAKQDATDWIKYDTCFLKEDMSRNFVSDMNLENAEIVDFMKDYKKVNDKNAHKLSVKLKDASIRELLFEAGFKVLFWGSEYNSIDLSDVSVQIDYYVDTETSQVVEVEVQLDGMEKFLRYYAQLYNNFIFEEDFKESKINRGKIIYKNISYEDIKVPMLSFEDKKGSLLVYQQDSTSNLKVMEAEAEVVCPRRWFIGEKGPDLLRIVRFDSQMYINYLLYMPYTYEDVEKEISHDIESFKEAGTYISDKKGTKIGDFETYEIVLQEGKISYAYKPIDRSMMVVCVQDYTDGEVDEVLPEILEKLKLKAIEW